MALSLAAKQIALIRRIDAETLYWLDGMAAVMHVGGIGDDLARYRRPGEVNRPPCVALEPRSNGQLMLSLTISRPRAGRLVYDTVIGQWDFSVPIQPDGQLNERRGKHRRLASWGLQLLRGLTTAAWQLKTGKDPEPLKMPRILVQPARSQDKQHADLVDASSVENAVVETAINAGMVYEDFSPVLGQKIHNPFRNCNGIPVEDGKYVAPSDVVPGQAQYLLAVRKYIGRGLSSGATDDDIYAAVSAPHDDMTLSKFSKVQVVTVEQATNLDAPYGGSLLPAVPWPVVKTPVEN